MQVHSIEPVLGGTSCAITSHGNMAEMRQTLAEALQAEGHTNTEAGQYTDRTGSSVK